MRHHSGRRIISTVVVAAALAGGLACGVGTAAADSSDPAENVIHSRSEATLATADTVGSSDTLLTSTDMILSPVVYAGLDVVGTVCSTVRNLLLGQNYCLARPGMDDQV
ncbi:hypothetical protein [Rhodococcus sp. NPDC059234]|uniref:hypothetical protein n=1 Tax=Rhodococcus sp. NPDC059234 TaxID=3346781 RepID=UPI0036734499